VLAHEQAHRERGDALVNVVATIWLCLSWFNPLMYWAVARLRFDQELACDAVVLAPRATLRRRYAAALLRTQLAAEAGPPVPIGCAWQSVHPLKERIAMLKRPLPTTTRRFSASMLTCATLVAGSYVAWTALPRVAYAQSDPHRVTLTADRLVASRAGDYELSGNVVLRSTAPGTGLNARKSPFEPQVLGLEDEDVSSAPRVGPLRSVPRGGPLRYVYTIMEWRGEVPPPFQVEVDVGRVSRETDGSAQLEGPIRISFAPGGLLTTDRATIAADGTIRMDSARFTRTAQAQ
jgi:hypothetical protein